VTGFARSTAGQRIRLLVVETLHGRTIKRRSRALQVEDRWTQLPTVRFGSTGRRNSMISVRVKGQRASFLADKLALRS